MPDEAVDFEVVRRIGAALPDVAASAGGRGVALKIGGRILACTAIHKSAEPDSLMVRVGFERRDALLAEDAEAFYLTGHYARHPVVLVRLPRVSRGDLSALLQEAAAFVRSEGEQRWRRPRRAIAWPGADPRPAHRRPAADRAAVEGGIAVAAAVIGAFAGACYVTRMKDRETLFDRTDARAEDEADGRADADVRDGRLISHGAVRRWLESWTGGKPMPRPRVGD